MELWEAFNPAFLIFFLVWLTGDGSWQSISYRYCGPVMVHKLCGLLMWNEGSV